MDLSKAVLSNGTGDVSLSINNVQHRVNVECFKEDKTEWKENMSARHKRYL